MIDLVNGSWVFNMQDKFVVSVDSWLDDISQIEIYLISLNFLNVISVSWVRELIILLESHVKGIWILFLIFITKKLGINLNMDDRVSAWILGIKFYWESRGNLILIGIVPSSSLCKWGWNDIINFCFDLESFSDKVMGLVSCFKLKLESIRSPFHLLYIFKLYRNLRTPIQDLDFALHLFVITWVINFKHMSWNNFLDRQFISHVISDIKYQSINQFSVNQKISFTFINQIDLAA